MEMLFHRRQAAANALGNLLVAATFADQIRQLAFASGKSGKMRKVRRLRVVVGATVGAKIFKLHQKLRARNGCRTQPLDISGRPQALAARRMDGAGLRHGLVLNPHTLTFYLHGNDIAGTAG